MPSARAILGDGAKRTLSAAAVLLAIAVWVVCSRAVEAGEGTGGLDLQISQTQVGTCRAGSLCWFDVHVSNLTDKPFSGTLLVRIDLDPDGAEFVGARPESWTCGQSGIYLGCFNRELTLASNTTVSLKLRFQLPASWPHTNLRHCAMITWLASAPPGETVRAVQIELRRLGMFNGSADGVLSPALEKAISAYETSAGLTASVSVTPKLVEALFGADAWNRNDTQSANDRSCKEVAVANDMAAAAPPAPPPSIQAPAVLPTPVPTPGNVDAPGTPENECTVGQVLDNGKCLDAMCPEDKIAKAGKCLAADEACMGGTIENGQCICPPGKSPKVGTCMTPEEIAGCGPNQTFKAGKCWAPGDVGECAPNEELVDGSCKPKSDAAKGGAEGPVCAGDKIAKAGKCLAADEACMGGTIENGQCICPPGKSPKVGTCMTPEEIAACAPNEIMKAGKCLTAGEACTGGTIESGQCVCPPGKSPKVGTCMSPEEIAACAPNEIMTAGKCLAAGEACTGGTIENGQCVCPPGASPKAGTCMTPEAIAGCQPDENVEGGACIKKEAAGCPDGQLDADGNCIADAAGETCPDGSQPTAAGCIASQGEASWTCGGGKELGGVCICPQGQVQKHGQCIASAIKCKGGWLDDNDQCQCRDGWFLAKTVGQCFENCGGGVNYGNGKCACDEGMGKIILDEGKPSEGQYPHCVTEKLVTQDQCKDGEFINFTSDGNLGHCHCAFGTKYVDGACKPSPTYGSVGCAPFQQRLPSGHCACFNGQLSGEGVCAAAPSDDLQEMSGELEACKSGEKYKAGKCVKQDAGSDVCSPGQQRVRGKCSVVPTAKSTGGAGVLCIGGRVSNGHCLCGKGYSLASGRCEKNARGTRLLPPDPCKGGRVAAGGKCECGPKMILRGGACVMNDFGGEGIKCQGGRVVGRTCVCQRGLIPNNGVCAKMQLHLKRKPADGGTSSSTKKVDCPPGTTGTPPNCVLVKCPTGMVGKPPNCLRLGIIKSNPQIPAR